MRRIATTLGLACLAVMIIACGVRINQGGPPPIQNNPGNETVVPISAAQLAQEFMDGTAGSAYGLRTLEVTGIVTRLEIPRAWQKEPGPNDDTASIVFIVPVTDKKSGEKKDYTIRCILNPNVSPADRQASGLASGKSVTLRGKILVSDLNNPQASMQQCKVIKAGGQ